MIAVLFEVSPKEGPFLATAPTWVIDPFLQARIAVDLPPAPRTSISFSLAVDLQEVCHCLHSEGYLPLVVNLTRRELGIPVVFVIVPKMRFLETL